MTAETTKSPDGRFEADGTFRFGAQNVPPRAAWSWDDVYAVRVVLTTPNLHEIISQTDGFEETPNHAAPGAIGPEAAAEIRRRVGILRVILGDGDVQSGPFAELQALK